jgi:hypothetical protein
MDSEDQKKTQESKGSSVWGIIFIILGIVALIGAGFIGYRMYKSRTAGIVQGVSGPNAAPMPGVANRLNSSGAPPAAPVGNSSRV